LASPIVQNAGKERVAAASGTGTVRAMDVPDLTVAAAADSWKMLDPTMARGRAAVATDPA